MMTENIDGGQKMLSLGKPTFIKNTLSWLVPYYLLSKVLHFPLHKSAKNNKTTNSQFTSN